MREEKFFSSRNESIKFGEALTSHLINSQASLFWLPREFHQNLLLWSYFFACASFFKKKLFREWFIMKFSHECHYDNMNDREPPMNINHHKFLFLSLSPLLDIQISFLSRRRLHNCHPICIVVSTTHSPLFVKDGDPLYVFT